MNEISHIDNLLVTKLLYKDFRIYFPREKFGTFPKCEQVAVL